MLADYASVRALQHTFVRETVGDEISKDHLGMQIASSLP